MIIAAFIDDFFRRSNSLPWQPAVGAVLLISIGSDVHEMYLRAASGGGGALFGSQRLFILVPPRSVRFTQALRRFSDDDCATNFLTEGGRGSYSSLLSLACVVGGTHTLSNGNDSRRPASRSNRFLPLRQSSIWPAAVPKYPPPPSEKEDICCATVVWSSLRSRRLICQ